MIEANKDGRQICKVQKQENVCWCGIGALYLVRAVQHASQNSVVTRESCDCDPPYLRDVTLVDKPLIGGFLNNLPLRFDRLNCNCSFLSRPTRRDKKQ